LIAQISLLLLTPMFWIKAFKYLLLKILHTLFSETFAQTILSMLDKYIQKPINHYKEKIFIYYTSLNKTTKIVLWIFLIIFGFVLILFLLRSPLLLKLIWKKMLDFFASKGVKYIFTPYIEAFIAILSGFIFYRVIRIYLVKNIMRPLQRKFSKR